MRTVLPVLLVLVGAAAWAAEPLGQIQTAYAPATETALVADGQPDFVVCAPKGFYADLAAQVVRAVLGRDDPSRIIEATDSPPLDRQHVITLGCIAENPLLFRLYWSKYTAADLVTPGPKQGRVEVVVDPYPWCAGSNVIVLGGSDADGVKAAVDHFIAGLKRGDGRCAFPWELFETDAPKVDPASVAPPRDLSFGAFNNLATAYLGTTADVYVTRACQVLDGLYDEYPAGKRSDFTYADECTSPTTFYLWDVIEHHPSISAEARLRYQDLLYSVLLRGLPSHTYEWKALADGPLLVWNHTGCPLYGIYVGARYFNKHFPETKDFTADALQRCANAFTTQMKVWKAREDAHHYYRLAVETVMGYSAGEWNLEYIQSGNLKRIADYAIMTADNAGGAAGFGDTEALHSNATEMVLLEMGFAWLRDPGYLWRLNEISAHGWLNRYHRDVQPEPPARLAGIQVAPLARAIYDCFLTSDPYGGVVPPKPETTPEQAFDKISLRANFDPMGEYLLIDGFSSGMHMHYDANMIVRYEDRGRPFLIDDDYLIRQTTEHTGISLLRNGRDTERMPLYSALDLAHDYGDVACVRARLPAYNGADWTRNIVWLKGVGMLLVDEVKPRVPTDQDTVFDVFKLYDAGGVTVGADGVLRSVQPAVSPTQPEATFSVIPAEERSASLARRRSASSDLPSARLIERCASDQGRPVVFRNLLYASDALRATNLEVRPVGERWVALRGTVQTREVVPPLSQGMPYTFDTPPSPSYLDTPGQVLTDGLRPGPDNIKTGWVGWYMSSPTVTVDFGRAQSVRTIGADIMGGNQWGIRFPSLVTLETAGDDGQFRPAGEFRPTWPETGDRYTRQVTFENIDQPVRQIRLHFEKAPNEAFVFISEIWAAGGDQLSPPQTRTITALAGCGPLALPGLTVDADLAYLSPEEVCLSGARACQIGATKLPLPAQAPATAGTLPPVRLEGLPQGAKAAEALRAAIAKAFAAGRPGRFVMGSATPAQPPLFRWPKGEGAQMWPAPDGGLVLGAGGTVYRLDAQGKTVWQHELPDNVSSVGVGDLVGDGKWQVFAGTIGEKLYCLDQDGAELWQWEVQPKVLEWAGWNGKARVEQIRVTDLNGDGKNELLLGTKNSWLLALNAARETLWKYGYVFHGCRDLQIVDLDGSGRPQVLAANRYGSVTRHDAATGKLLTTYATELGDTFVACADHPAAGTPAVVSGSTTGRFHAFDVKGNVLWSFNNDGFSALAAVFTNDRVWLGSESGLLYTLDPKTGEAKQTIDLGCAVVALAPGKSGVLAFDERGGVTAVGLDGTTSSLGNVGGRPLQVLPGAQGWQVLTAEALFVVPAGA